MIKLTEERPKWNTEIREEFECRSVFVNNTEF